eukprot:3074280-Pyramimonas_sp.AAC.1
MYYRLQLLQQSLLLRSMLHAEDERWRHYASVAFPESGLCDVSAPSCQRSARQSSAPAPGTVARTA